MSRVRGLATTPPPLRIERKASGVVQTMRESVATSSRLHIDDIAPNPRNPPARTEQIGELVASVERRGVLVPILVTPVEEWLVKHPEDADHVVGRQWVAQDGHRRLAAARAGGRTEVPFAIRGVDMDEALIRLHTAKSLRLSPIEEAQQFRWLIDTEQMTQREIATETGVSQSHVAKRLKLLDLPATVQQVVDYGRVSVEAAVALMATKEPAIIERVASYVGRLSLGRPLAAEDDLDEAPVQQLDLGQMTQKAAAELELARAKDTAKEVAQKLRAEYCEDVTARLGEQAKRSHQLFSQVSARSAARKHNLLVVPAQRGEPLYYRIDAGSSQSDGGKLEQRLIGAAIQRRAKALRMAAATRVSPGQIQGALATLVLSGLGLGAGETTRLAYDLARDSGLAADGLGDLAFRRTLATVPDEQRLEHAWIIALAAFETYVRSIKVAWGPIHTYYFALLKSVADYVPGEWEQGRLDAITNLDPQ